MYQAYRINTALNKAIQVIVLGYQGVAAVVFVLSLWFAFDWLRTPFIGGFFEQTMVLNGSGTSEAGKQWALYEQGFGLGDQLIAVEDRPISNANDLKSALSSFPNGESLPVTLRTLDGETRTVEVTLQPFPLGDRITYVFIPAVLSFVFLAMSLWIFGLRRTEPAGRAFSMMAASLAIGIGSLFDLYTTHHFAYIWTMAVALSGGALIDLALAFPQEARFVFGRPYLRWFGYAAGIVLAFNAYFTLYDFANPIAYFDAWRIIYIFVGLSALFYFTALIYRAYVSDSPVVKSQARTILFGALLAFGPVVFWLLYSSLRNAMGGPGASLPFSPYLLVPLFLFPLVNGYVILRFRLLRTDDWVRQGLVYSALTILVVASYALLVSGLGTILSSVFAVTMPSNNPYLIGGLVFLIAVLLDPLRTRLHSLVDSTFFRGQRAYEDRLRAFSRDLTSALDLSSIGRVLRQQIATSLVPDRLHIYTYDTLNDQYVALADGDGRPTSDIRFSSNSPLVQYFKKENIPLYLDTINPPTILRGDEARLTLLGARLFIALPGEDKPVGWLALGTPLSGGVYTPKDLDFLDNLADQASVAIARVQTVIDLERRVQEMNALTRVSQGVNVTLTFDDVLELIFAQSTLIIPSSLFHITLYNKAGNYFYYGFCVEDNERMTGSENRPLPPSLGLGQEIIRTGRPILTQDYMRECRARTITPAAQGIYAWMGVPLNAGAETMGSLSVGSDDATVTYTRAQLDLLQAIADQTVGAIVKARLLQETEQRAHQLSTLNEITRQLTSTLEQEPLLQNILENAVNILNCEAGTLFLVDEQTGELIFRVMVGPVSSNLLGQRLPAGTGIVGRAVQARVPIIENDAQRSAAHFEGADKQTGFVSKFLLAVPMQIKDRVLGAIEVINRRDGLPFVKDDQNLLTAFAGQAAVAIENARLLALTDQELADKVEELQVMGRIVRELNASLEVARAMRTTLEWAMRRSNAEAGLIGMIEDGHLRLMAQQGYDDILAQEPGSRIPLDLPALRSAIESGQPNQISLVSNGARGILPSAHTQIIVPIRREVQVIGLLLLESTSDSQTNLAFLNNLSDSAAIAIANAQLYDEVQRANLAKSDFVSFVAHELKNPMTSIKGYTELLAAGSVGQINEMQTNFLGTIRSNVERMSALVSDLNDNAKIEAGRLRLDYKPVDMADVVDEVVRSTRRQLDEKRQTLESQIPEELPAVWADRIRVGQVLTNLVSNAHKYTSEGGHIKLGAEVTANQWDPEGARQVVHLWVRDNGIGISVEDQAKIFQKFFRSDDTKAREAPGTGLGLNITKSLVEMQGGRIWFDSEYRKGTTFHFTIPVAES
ncbi:MAG TPA: GAF domain-containing protein [Anaerolineales bacterium]|nr:GAF domain-containing protein [Anaerolineales bacterium]